MMMIIMIIMIMIIMWDRPHLAPLRKGLGTELAAALDPSSCTPPFPVNYLLEFPTP